MTDFFRKLEAKREEDEWREQQAAAVLHANTEYDASKLNRMARYAIRKSGIPISARGTMKGTTVLELDQKLQGAGLTGQEVIALKYSLWVAGILKR